ncbi:hypothetical protein MKX53_06765 [Psychrobacillus sp. FSL K6-4615]|uniref:hypothetical protein n=1 Tax=Psychrobacillus sp. FSL K6-4615 TaxID=2921551 RepID=UPI0030F7D7E0
MKYHVISAKRLGRKDSLYEYLFFPVNDYSESDAIAQFQPVEKLTNKYNHIVPYTAYEYDGDTYHHIIYSGIADESEIND